MAVLPAELILAAELDIFELFVEHRIKGAMLDELCCMDYLPRRLWVKIAAMQKVLFKLQNYSG
jgi:hypothetical protein